MQLSGIIQVSRSTLVPAPSCTGQQLEALVRIDGLLEEGDEELLVRWISIFAEEILFQQTALVIAVAIVWL